MRITNSAAKYFVLLFILALSAAFAKSQSVTIKILSIQGSVQISHTDSLGTRLITYNPNDNLSVGDIIKTNGNGRIVLLLSDNSQAVIGEKTTVEIKDTSSSPRTIFNVLRGKTRIKIEKLGGKPNPYRVTTPTAVIAVRGTEFDVFVKDDQTKVYVTEGKVSVTNIAFSQEVILTPGNFTEVRRNQPPLPPIQFNPQQNDRFFSSKDNEQVANNPNNHDNKDNKTQNNGGNQPRTNQQGRESGNQPNSPGSPNQGGAPTKKPRK